MTEGSANLRDRSVQLTSAQRCAKVSDGKRCGGYAIAGTTYCFAHDPASAEKRNAARSRGGRIGRTLRTAKLSQSIPADLRSPGELMQLVEVVLRGCITGTIDPRIASAMSNLVRTQAALLDSFAFDERLKAIEERQRRSEEMNGAQR